MERVMGIEPTQPAWKAGVLPLNYTRTVSLNTSSVAYNTTGFTGCQVFFWRFFTFYEL